MNDPAKYREFLGKMVDVVIDRPLGSMHPRFDFVYETNYGYLPGTLAGDGHEIDAYVLAVSEPVARCRGRCVGMIMRADDDEHKLVVAPRAMTIDEIADATHFVERWYDIRIEIAGENLFP